jgi:arabinogalactan endo-1,4-beta-galactosidase
MLWKHSSPWSALILVLVIGASLSAGTRAGAAPSPTSTLAMPAGINVAIGRPVTASSATGSQPATNAVDGDPQTSWCFSAGTTEAELIVTLDKPRRINGTGVTWVGRAPAHYEVSYAPREGLWQPLPATRLPGSALTSFDRVDGQAAPARFVRLSISDSAGLPCVGEFRVYVSDPATNHLIRGVDLSTLRALEAAGRSFSDAQGTRPAEQILADHGANLVRLRLWVDPEGQFNDLDDVAAMALRIKRANMRFLLDLHYSDFWADPGHQDTPAAWQGQDLATLATTVHDYTRDVVAMLRAQGTPPDIVQVGNEVTAGMLWPQGQIYVGSQQRWVEFTTLLKAGIAGARAGAPPGHAPQIMVHIDRGGDLGGTQWFYDHMVDYGVDFDMIGLSYYSYWHGSLSDVRRNLDNTAARYGKPIIIVETAYAWTFDDYDGHPNIISASTSPLSYPVNPEGQALFIRDLLSLTARTPGQLGLGVVYWEPAWIPGVGWKIGEGNAWENQTVFGPDGNALPSVDMMRP